MSKRVSSPAFEYIQRERERERERERDVKKKTREIERDKKQTLARGGDAQSNAPLFSIEPKRINLPPPRWLRRLLLILTARVFYPSVSF